MTLIDKESWDAMTEDTKRLCRNIKRVRRVERTQIFKAIRLWFVDPELAENLIKFLKYYTKKKTPKTGDKHEN